MVKKRAKMKLDSSGCFFFKEKKAQITIFIILGIVILFAAIMVIQLSKSMQSSELGQEQEKVLGKVFQKEGLKLYVDDCLEDELEKGLILLGKHGRIPKSEPGGSIVFTEGVTGVFDPVSKDKIFYGITNKKHYPDNKYPCLEGKEPDFCKYKYPNSSILPGYPISFGERKLTMGLIESDLENYLINGTIFCVENFTKNNVSSAAKVSTENLKAELNILDDGIKVTVDYPLKLSLGKEEFFNLITFDFFYKSQFKKFLESAVTRPLNFDASFVDFVYNKVTLQSTQFTHGCFDSMGGVTSCTTTLSPITGMIKKFASSKLVNGDDLFKFTEISGILKDSKILPVFQFARQNRPPALDYIERDSCDEDSYDYLVIQGETGDIGKIDISLIGKAKDPDEDKTITYEFKEHEKLTGLQTTIKDKFSFTPTISGWYNITAIASDGKLQDNQTIRILVDNTIKTKASFEMPYKYSLYHGTSEGVDRYAISIEDPVFLKITLPEKSKVEKNPKITLSYLGKQEPFSFDVPDSVKDNCFSFPWLLGCDISKYSSMISSWNNVNKQFDYFKKVTNGAYETLTLDYSITYCDKNGQSDTTKLDIQVNECIPHRNYTNPWPYPYHKYEYGLKSDKTTDFSKLITKDDKDANPFLASHACCNSKWEVEGTNKLCFQGETKKGCFKTKESTFIEGYILAEKTPKAYCDGKRGNICNGIKKDELKSLDVCGYNTYSTCSGIPTKCEGKTPYYVNQNKDGFWCYGTLGCSSICEDVVVDGGDTILFNKGGDDVCRSCTTADAGRDCYNFNTGIKGKCDSGGSCS